MKEILHVKNLELFIQNKKRVFHILRGITFSLYQGERLGVVGESGSGKTILMKTLLKLFSATSIKGEVIYKGVDLLSIPSKQLQKIRGKEIGIIFQDPMTSLNPTMKIGDQIAEGYRRHYSSTTKKEAKGVALQLLKQVGMPDPELRLQQYPHLLSGGMRQRALIALALAPQPNILIADEATTSLDTTVQAQIINLFQQLQKNKSMILTSHDLSLVASFSDRLIVLYAGQVVEEAKTATLFKEPKHPYTKKLLQLIPRLEKQEPLFPISGPHFDLSLLGTGCAFCPKCPQAMKICEESLPPLFKIGDHQVRCWLFAPKP